jgi:hypothetical protein
MLHSLKELMDDRLRVAGRGARVDDAFFDPDVRRLKYLAVDIGGWFSVDEVIVAADLLVPPAGGEEHWTLRLDEEAIAHAPRWGAEESPAPLDVMGWPSIIVGPFGGTYAPIMMYEQLVASREETVARPPSEGSGDALVWRMDRATEWLGRPAFGTDGELGQVEDLLFDDRTLDVSWFVLGSGGIFAHRTGAVPISALRRMARGGTHLVFDLAKAEAEAIRPPPA